MKEQDAISKRGLVWQCMQCDFAAEKRYAINHVYVYHKTTDETPYHCSLCNFKSMDLKSLQAHVWRYQAHKKAKEQSGKSNVDDKVFLVENKAPTRIMEGIDIAPWTVAKSREFWHKRQKKQTKRAEWRTINLSSNCATPGNYNCTFGKCTLPNAEH